MTSPNPHSGFFYFFVFEWVVSSGGLYQQIVKLM